MIKTDEEHNKKKKYPYFILLIMALALCFAVLCDCGYHSLINKTWLNNILIYLKSKKPKIMSYKASLEILKSTIGMLMTTISIFLNMAINIATRKEQKVFGISRNELHGQGREIVYVWMKRWNYVSPILMIVFINLSFCISGYLVFFYCYLFSLLHYYIHASSFSRGKDQKNLINKIVAYNDKEDIKENKMSEYVILLENMRRSIVKEGNWTEVEKIYKEIIEKIDDSGLRNGYKIYTLFYQKIYWADKNNENIAIYFMQNYLSEWEKDNIKEIDSGINKWCVLWGLIKNTLCMASEDSVVVFLSWILEYSKRSDKACKDSGKSIPVDVFKVEWEMCIIALECRFLKFEVESMALEQIIKKLWELAEAVFVIERGKYVHKIIEIEYITSGQDMQSIANNIIGDYLHNSQRTKVASIVHI